MEDSFKIDFIGIGAPKAGTTWLGHMLEDHPELCMSIPKEVHFFNDKLTYRNQFLQKNYSKGIQWYKKHFNHCQPGKLKGEITPRYCEDPLAPERIKAHNPAIKIIYNLRNPVERIESHYNFAKYFVNKEDRPIRQAIIEEPEFVEMSLYYRNLTNFLRHFPKEQILLVWFEDIIERPEELLKEVYTFLGVDPDFKPSTIREKSNPSRKSQVKGLQVFIRKITHRMVSLGLSGLVGKLKKAGLGNWIATLNSKPFQKEKIPPDIRQYIIDRVRDDVMQLESWSGRNLSHWLQ